MKAGRKIAISNQEIIRYQVPLSHQWAGM